MNCSGRETRIAERRARPVAGRGFNQTVI